jgi:hypothetical protein
MQAVVRVCAPYGAGGCFYIPSMPRNAVFIASLLDAPYVGGMALRRGTSECRQPPSARFWSRSYEREQMSHWRWLLFAAMARVEVTEATYLRFPNAKTIPHDVMIDVPPRLSSCSGNDAR